MLCNLTPPPQLPLSFNFPGAAAQPCSVMSTVSQRSIHALSALSTSECRVNFRVLDETRYLKFSYREIKFSKINIPRHGHMYKKLVWLNTSPALDALNICKYGPLPEKVVHPWSRQCNPSRRKCNQSYMAE